MADLAALIERLAEADDESWELDRDIGLAVGGWSYVPDDHEVAKRYPERRWLQDSEGSIFADHPGSISDQAFTASLDAALGLVQRLLPDWGWSVGEPLRHPGHWASVWREGFSIGQDGQIWRAEEGRTGLQPDKSTGAGEIGHKTRYAATPAIALCLAAIRAVSASATPDGETR